METSRLEKSTAKLRHCAAKHRWSASNALQPAVCQFLVEGRAQLSARAGCSHDFPNDSGASSEIEDSDIAPER